MDFCPQMIQRIQNLSPKNCDICDYHTSNIKDFKNIAVVRNMVLNGYSSKTDTPYYTCANCDYISCSKQDMVNHFLEFSHAKMSPNLSPKEKIVKTEALEKEKISVRFLRESL